LYASPDIITVIKSRRMSWRNHVYLTWERYESHTKFWSEDLKGRDHSEDLCVDGSKILE